MKASKTWQRSWRTSPAAGSDLKKPDQVKNAEQFCPLNGSSKDSLQLRWLKHSRRRIQKEFEKKHTYTQNTHNALTGYSMYQRDRKNGGGELVGSFDSNLPPNKLKMVKAYKTLEIKAID